MTLSRTAATTIGIFIVAVYAIGSGVWVSSGDTWYRTLRAPYWQPPDWVFGVAWPYNFTVLTIVSVLVSRRLSNSNSIAWLAFFAVSVAFALLWANQFYQAHNLGIAAATLDLAAIFTIPLLVIAAKVSWWAVVILIPYQLWMAIAASLSWGYLQNN